MCGTCVPAHPYQCESNEDCNIKGNVSSDTRPKACLLSALTNDMRCLPTCPLSIENTIIENPYTPSITKATCIFHHEFVKMNPKTISKKEHVKSHIDIYCNRDQYNPVWMVKDKNLHSYPLPACQFVPNYCSEELLKTIGNGEAKFTPGKTTTINSEEKLRAHSANIQCNDDGFHLSVRGDTWKGTKEGVEDMCQRDLSLVCGEINKTRTWKTSNQQPIDIESIKCNRGCVLDNDCKEQYSYCDQKTCGCEQYQCPHYINHGELGCECGHIGFNNIFYCNKGYTVAHPDYIIYWYLDCIKEDTDCTTNKMRSKVDIKCNIDPTTMKAEWVLNYPQIFDGAVPKQFFNLTVPARCVEGCETDENCPYGEECVARETNDCTSGNCPPGVCTPYRCKDYSDIWGGSLVGKNFSSVGQRATFKCKEGYFMPNLTVKQNVYRSEKRESSAVFCQKLSNTLIPEWRLADNPTIGGEIPQCLKDCATNEDCDPRDRCDLTFGGGACLPKQCSTNINFGILKQREILDDEGNASKEYMMFCHGEYILRHRVKDEAYRSHRVSCSFNVTGGNHVKWVFEKSETTLEQYDFVKLTFLPEFIQ